jgi:hypothetical protein
MSACIWTREQKIQGMQGNKDDPYVVGVLYSRQLSRVAENHPLKDCKYFGQVVRRYVSAELAARHRWISENWEAHNKEKQIGLLAAIVEHGPEAFDNDIIEYKFGKRSKIQPWADEFEIKLIKDNGGPLRDPTAPLLQTLNLTHGGKGKQKFVAVDALIAMKWDEFKTNMILYVDSVGSGYVPSSVVLDSGYRLGEKARDVRRGRFWKGSQYELERVEFLESLPGWVWNGREHEDYLKTQREDTTQRWKSDSFRSKVTLGVNLHWVSEEARKAHSNKLAAASKRPDVVQARSIGQKRRFQNEDERSKAVLRLKSAREDPDTAQRCSDKKKETWHSKQALKMSTMTTEESIKYQIQVERSRRKHVRRQQQLEALRKVPGFQHATNKDIPIARQRGILPSID